jgi:hypothetical protein
VVGRDPRVGVWRHGDRLDAGRKLDQRALVHEHVVGKAAVARQAGEAVALAVHVEAAPARNAESAAVRRVEEHRVSGRRRGDIGPDRVHPARVLVAEHDRRPEPCAFHEALDRVQIGCADPCPADSHNDVAGSDRLRLGPVDELQGPVVFAQERRLHALAPR